MYRSKRVYKHTEQTKHYTKSTAFSSCSLLFSPSARDWTQVCKAGVLSLRHLPTPVSFTFTLAEVASLRVSVRYALYKARGMLKTDSTLQGRQWELQLCWVFVLVWHPYSSYCTDLNKCVTPLPSLLKITLLTIAGKKTKLNWFLAQTCLSVIVHIKTMIWSHPMVPNRGDSAPRRHLTMSGDTL